jgi:hypothetical protein
VKPRIYFSENRALFGWLAALGLIALGCGPRHQTAAPVNVETARQTLQSVLESWQRGEKLDSWRQHDPEVVIQDMDWSADAKLKEFEILGDGEPRDANLYCKVKLVFNEQVQGKTEKEVTYVVGTDPVLTVFRDPFQ